MQAPRQIQLIGTELAIVWGDSREDYLDGEFLREHSPSAENIGEVDVLGQKWGGNGPRSFPGVMLQTFEYVGNYAIRPVFSDGHKTGIFSWKYLRELAEKRSASE